MNATKHTQQMCRQVGIHSVVDRDYYMFCGNPISDSTVTTVPSTHSYKGLQCAKVLTLSKVAFLHVHAVPVTEVVMSSALLMLLEAWQSVLIVAMKWLIDI